MLPQLTLVIGGAASGKSRYAEQLVVATGRPRHYLATAQTFDAEMKAKVARHLDQRGADWTTIEAPIEAATALSHIPAKEVVLFDCVTLWLTNHLLVESNLDIQIKGLMTALRDCPGQVVVVSNEVGAGIVPDNTLSRRFREEQGRLNQRIASQANLVVTVIAGLPLALKGTLPEAKA